MGETGVEISHKYPTNLFIGETKPKREKKRTRETAQILQKVSKKDEAKHKMFHQAESRWGPFQKRERPPNCLTKLVKITQATLINLVHFYFFLMQWWIDLTLIYITRLPFSDLINLIVLTFWWLPTPNYTIESTLTHVYLNIRGRKDF